MVPHESMYVRTFSWTSRLIDWIGPEGRFSENIKEPTSSAYMRCLRCYKTKSWESSRIHWFHELVMYHSVETDSCARLSVTPGMSRAHWPVCALCMVYWELCGVHPSALIYFAVCNPCGLWARSEQSQNYLPSPMFILSVYLWNAWPVCTVQRWHPCQSNMPMPIVSLQSANHIFLPQVPYNLRILHTSLTRKALVKNFSLPHQDQDLELKSILYLLVYHFKEGDTSKI